MDSESIESLGNMPECNKRLLNEIDPISRTSKCDKSVKEIFDVDEPVSFSSMGEEEMEILDHSELSTDDIDRAMKLGHDIDCLIRQIEVMQIAIRRRQVKESSEMISEKSEEPYVETLTKAQMQCKEIENQEKENDFKIKEQTLTKWQPLKDEELLKARSLLQAHHRLQCEIDELICRYRKLKEVITKMYRNTRCMRVNIKELISKTKDELAWADEVAKEIQVCHDRFTYLSQAKMSKREGIKTVRVHADRFEKLNDAYLRKSRLKHDIFELSEESIDLLQFMRDILQELDRNMSIFGSKSVNRKESLIEFLESLTVASSLCNKFRDSLDNLQRGDE
ncbi:uncharacterized protein LOC108113635 [Drosophila eugracilis]|uniref:uncharacterized protein LOC108113635 n=1 Tax=Drosophila eugracilis TaxID=29029 RepID=UPI0007E5D1DD|nr:uncharacterized protein LOC108113635 [Drosophila eugracilis]